MELVQRYAWRLTSFNNVIVTNEYNWSYGENVRQFCCIKKGPGPQDQAGWKG